MSNKNLKYSRSITLFAMDLSLHVGNVDCEQYPKAKEKKKNIFRINETNNQDKVLSTDFKTSRMTKIFFIYLLNADI